MSTENTPTWRNWAGNKTASPRFTAYPKNTGDVQALVQQASRTNRKLRAIGSSHSFTAAAQAPDVLVDMFEMSGLISMDEQRQRGTFYAGTRLWQLPELLAPYHLAVQNMGDINRQSLAGVLSTSTHGTGRSFGGFGAQVTALKLVTGTGEILEVDETKPELLDALRVSLGAYGLLTEVTVQLVNDYDVHTTEYLEDLDFILDHWRELNAEHDHLEFFWFGHANQVVTKKTHRQPAQAEEPSTASKIGQFLRTEVLENVGLGFMCELGKAVPKTVPTLNKIGTQFWGGTDRTRHWSRGFATPRRVKFVETEYALPFDDVPAAIHEIRELFARRPELSATFPFEVRSAAPDTGWLSTAYERPTGYIAVHQYVRENHRELFGEVQKIFEKYQGRPHWGKLHTLGKDDFAQLYPRWQDSLKLRDKLDPQRIFANKYLERVMGQ